MSWIDLRAPLSPSDLDDAAISEAPSGLSAQAGAAVPQEAPAWRAGPAAYAVYDGAPEPEPEPEPDRGAALRALRNLEATEARLTRNARRELDEARGKLVSELLPVLDNLDRTIRAAHANRSDPAMLEGVRMVRQQLEGVLRGYGVERIDAVEQIFDPSLHEAIAVTAVGDPRHHGRVIEQAEPGYRYAGKLLRPAKVTVGRLAQGTVPPLAWR